MIIKNDNAQEYFEDGQPQQPQQVQQVSNNSCQKPANASATQQCTTKCSENQDLLPIMDPLFNMRECVKQCILLEDHLFQTKKRCQDCIKKHFLTMEGLAEEAITLDKENKYKLCDLKLADRIRDIERNYINEDDPIEIAQSLRQIRKPLMAKYFGNFE